MVVFFGLLLLEIVSLGLCFVAIRQLYAYINRYRFDESVYTLLFGMIRLRYFVSFYVFLIATSALMGLLFLFSYLRFGA
jgi:hypothetical protein